MSGTIRSISGLIQVGGKRRTGLQRLDAIAVAVAQRDEFMSRVKAAEGDAVRCADLMAEAISMKIEANKLEVVGRDGRIVVTMEEIAAAHCMISARDAYLRARGSNQIAAPPVPSVHAGGGSDEAR